MLKNKLIVLAAIGALCSVSMNAALASGTTGTITPSENIQPDGLDACKGRTEGEGCMYINNDTKFTGTCQKHDDKLTCDTIKE